MIDYGFDISDYYKVRENLGGNAAFDKFLKECNNFGIKVFIDIVFNHISRDHIWFKKALQGDKKYIKYFYNFQITPQLLEKYTNDKAAWAVYLINNKKVSIPIVFPELVGELPHFYRALDNSYYYHTFYPSQIDLNWGNPEVFIEMAEILIFWSKKNLNFRLDAVPFMGKDFTNNNLENTSSTHLIIKALKKIVNTINPESVFLAEANVPINKISEYFGDLENKESELVYGFKIMENLWATIFLKNILYLKRIVKFIEVISRPSSWLTLLRTHDELSLDLHSNPEFKIFYDKLNINGLPFRNGLGVSGRTYSLLGNDKERFLMAYFLLTAIPGNPALLYGDEIGKKNDSAFMKKMTRSKIETINDENINDDTRDINRGVLSENELLKKRSVFIHSQISKIFNNRLKNKKVYTTLPIISEVSKGLILIKYKLNDKIICIYINLDENTKTLHINKNLNYKLTINKVSLIKASIIKFGKYGCLWSEEI